MFTFILILLLVAAIFGVLGAVLKVALVLVLALVLAVTFAAWAGWYWLKHRMRQFEREVDRQREEEARRARAVEVRHVPNEADRSRDPLELPDDGERA